VTKQVAAWILRLGLGALFAVTGALKLADPAGFAVEIHNYQILPALAPLLAATLPMIEIALAAALIVGRRPWVRAGALGTGALSAVFTVAVGSVIARGLNISCGCFGAGSGPVTWLTVLRDVALVGACVALFRMAAPAPPRARAAA
jgi:uncharacterized membrane protein YphA (DoxX/SURF4 family)